MMRGVLFLGPIGGPHSRRERYQRAYQAARARRVLVLADQLLLIRFLLIDCIESQFQAI